jgi:hypothetical protein
LGEFLSSFLNFPATIELSVAHSRCGAWLPSALTLISSTTPPVRVAALSELAKREKDPISETKLLHAQNKLAEQKRRLARLNAEHPVLID